MKTLIITALCAAAAASAADAPKRPRITGVAHIALFTHDIEKSRAFYKNFLGFGKPFQLKNADGSLALTFIKVNDRQYIELFPEKEANTGRLNHISIETDDAEAMRVYLGSRGVQVPGNVGKGRIGNSNFNVTDPDGHTVEIVQYEPDGWTARENGKHMDGLRVSKRMAHLGIDVRSLEPAMKFYHDVLGFQETMARNRKRQANLYDPDGTRTELMEPGTVDASPCRRPQRRRRDEPDAPVPIAFARLHALTRSCPSPWPLLSSAIACCPAHPRRRASEQRRGLSRSRGTRRTSCPWTGRGASSGSLVWRPCCA